MIGIIPARAGFTPPPISVRVRAVDHPRSRGVYSPDPFELGEILAQNDGSSPLARGLHTKCRGLNHHPGIIPARAGFTCALLSGGGAPEDHPRSRGVYRVGR